MMRDLRLICIAALLTCGTAPAEPDHGYQIPPAFTPLPLGEVKPAGWLKDWCEQAADGITGHSDDLDPLFAKGWLDANFKATSTGAQGGDKVVGYAMEQAGYWIDGAVRLARLIDDDKLLAKCHTRFETVLKRVEAGETPVTSKALWEAGEKWGHWPMAIMGRAMLAEYTHTGDKRYLDAIAKIYADYPKYNAGKKFSLIHHQGRQLANIEVMLEAHRLGGPDSLRTDALTVLAAQNPEIQQRLAWHEQGITRGKVDANFNSVPYGHAVTVNESMKIPGIGYMYSGDKSWLRFSEAGFEDFEKNEMMPYGLTSAHEHVGGIGPFSASELCNAVDYAWSSTWMLRVTGKPFYADRIERAVFNAGASGISPDFKTHQYFLASNRIDAEHPGDYPVGGGPDYQPKHFPLCCTGNLSRLIPDYVMHMWMRAPDGGLAATLHGPSNVLTTIRGVKVSLATRTDYPFRETLTTRVDPERAFEFPVSFRVPAWCATPAIEVNGNAVTPVVRDGFATIERTWSRGDVARVSFPNKPRFITGRCADGAPFASVCHGPLLFALPIPHETGNLNRPRPGVEWRFALDPSQQPAIITKPMPQPWTWAAAPVEISISAIPAKYGENFSLPQNPVTGERSRSKEIRLRPFGTTAFRISMFAIAN
jgi:uncharacterized protein